MILQLDEIVPGLVSHLDPAVLNRFNVYSPIPARIRVAGVHPFVCLDVADDECVWAALSSSSSHGRRVMLPRSAKLGGEKWTRRDSYIYGPEHWLFGPCYAFQEASECERTQVRARNSVTASGLQLVRAMCRYFRPNDTAWSKPAVHSSACGLAGQLLDHDD